MDGGAWWATVNGVAKSWTQLSDFTFSFNPSHRVVVRIWLRIWKQLIEVGKDLKGLCNLNLVYNQKNLSHNKGFPGGPSDNKSVCQRATGGTGLIPGLGKPPGEGNGNPLQYSWQDNPMDSGAWKATVHGFIKSPTQVKQRRTHAHPTMSLVSQFFFKGYLPSISSIVDFILPDFHEFPLWVSVTIWCVSIQQCLMLTKRQEDPVILTLISV